MPLSFTPQRLYFFALYLTAFLIPFPYSFTSAAIIFTALTWLFTVDIKGILPALKQRKALWVFIAFFIAHACSYFYSADKSESLFDLQTKLSLLILPLIVGTGPSLDKAKTEKLFGAFISGLTLIALYCIIKAFGKWQSGHNTEVFFYHNLIDGLSANAVYYALYSFMGLSILVLYQWEDSILKWKLAYYFVLLVLVIFFILLSSKTLLLLLFVLLVPVYLRKLFLRSRKTAIAVSFIGILLIGLISFTHNPIRTRYIDLTENSDQKDWKPELSNGQKQHFNNLTLRLFLWQTALNNVQEHNLWLKGCGNGGVKQLQKQKILSYGSNNKLLNVDPPLWDYNLHNMYLQVLMMLGLPGLVLFVLLLIMPFFMGRKLKDWVLFAFFNISIVIFMFQEAALQTQAGILFFLFFSMVFYNLYYTTKGRIIPLSTKATREIPIIIHSWKPYAVIAGVMALAYGQIVFLDHALLWDAINATFPARFYCSECFRSGTLPLWMPFQYTGYPFFADPQSGIWYPGTWLFSVLGRYSLAYLDYEYLISISIGGCGIYQLAKLWTSDKTASVFAAICYTCCGVFVSNAEHITWTISAAWLPWLFRAYYLMVTRRETKFAAVFALVLYVIATGGYPAFLIISFYLLAIVFMALLFMSQFRRNLMKILGLHLLLVVLCLGCCSVVFYSVFSGMGLSTRSAGVTLEMALFYPFSPACFTSFLLPFSTLKSFDLFHIDITMTNGYFGLFGFILMLLGLFGKKDKQSWLIMSLSFICLLAAVGDVLPFRKFLYNHVPGMNVFRFPSSFRLFFIIGSLIISAVAFKNLKDNYTRGRKLLIGLSGGFILVFIGVITYTAQKGGLSGLDWNSFLSDQANFLKHATYYQHLFLQSLIQIILLGVFLLVIIRGDKTRLNVKLFLIICAIDLIVSVQLNLYGTVLYSDSLKDTQTRIDKCPEGFPSPSDTVALYRNFDERYWWELSPIQGNLCLIKKVPGRDGYNPFNLRGFEQFMASKIRDSVWRNPPAYFANKIISYDSLMMMGDKRNVVIDSSLIRRHKINFSQCQDDDSIAFTQFGPNKISVATRASGSRMLVLQQNNIDGWEVHIDGKLAPFNEVNLTYIGIVVPAGIHEVTLEFKPVGVYLFLGITIFMLLTCLAIIYFDKIRGWMGKGDKTA